MAITFVGSDNNANALGSGVNLNLPAMNQNDLVVVVGMTGNATGNGGDFDLVINGYTLLIDLKGADATYPRVHIAYKVMGASPDTSVFVNGTGTAASGLIAMAMAFRGVSTSTPIDGSVNSSGVHPTPPDPSAITPTLNNGCIVAIAGAQYSDATLGSVTNYLPSPSLQNTANTASGLDVTGGMVYRILSGGASVSQDPGVWSTWDNANNWRSVTIALRSGIITETITVDKASAVVTGKIVTVGELNPVPVVKATVTSAGKTVTIRELELVPIAKASATLSGRAVVVLSAGAEVVGVDKAVVAFTGKAVTTADTPTVITVDKAVLALTGKPLTLVEKIAITKATVTLTGRTVTAVSSAFEHIPKYIIRGRGSRHAIKGRGSRVFLVMR